MALIAAALTLSEMRDASACSYLQYHLEEVGPCPDGLPNKRQYRQTADWYCCDAGFLQTTPTDTLSCDYSPEASGFFPDGAIGVSSCQNADPPQGCTGCGVAAYCDGLESQLIGAVDSQCGDDEHACGGRGRDGNPVHYDTGVAETVPRTLFSAPGNGGLSFDYAVQYRSHAVRPPASWSINDPTQDRHFLGHGFIDTFSDRLVVPWEVSKPIVWLSLDRTVTFLRDGTGLSRGGKFHLTDRGSSMVPRWVVKSLSPDEVKRTWEFRERNLGQFQQVGMLHAMTAAAVVGGIGIPGYRIDIARTSSGDERITGVTDSLGRQMRVYYQFTPYNGIWRVERVTYRAAPALAETDVAQYGYSGNKLTRITLPLGYVRYNYMADNMLPDPCIHCEGLLTQVIIPVHPYTSTPLNGSPAQAHELVVEGHEFEFLANEGPRNGTPRVRRSWGPSSSWAYHYDVTRTVQLDLLQQKAPCSAGECPTGQACWAPGEGGDDRCYIANERTLANGVVAEVANGGAPDEDESHYYDANGRPRATVSRGVITSYAFDAVTGEVSCLVRNDIDYDALTSGQCLPFPTGPLVQVVKPTRSGGTTSKSFPSHVQPGQTRTETTTHGSHGLVTRQESVGWTRNIDGTPMLRTRATQTTYDTLGRTTQIDGPLDNSVAYDVTDFVYHDSLDDNRGHLRYIRRYVGTGASNVMHQTEFLDYDLFGVARRVIGPSGAVVKLTSANRLDWTIKETAGASSVSSSLHLNPDGSLRSAIDADGVCVTSSYNPYSGQSITKRSDAMSSECNQVPIDTATGEVEIRQHVPNDPPRTVSIVRMLDGVTRYEVSGFTYDDARQLTAKTASGTSAPFVVEYADALFKGITAPDWPAAGSWKSEIDADALGRPSALRRYLDPNNAQTTALGYSSGWDGTPTQLRRGLNGSVAQTTTFAYDDFGALLETSSADSGVTRWEYDHAGQTVKERVATGSAVQRTVARAYDSLGRATSVDHDTEHPVTCGSAADGTPISDEVYTYDTCSAPPGFACTNALGQLTMAKVLQHCLGGEVVATGRWYAYDEGGNLLTSRSATQVGAMHVDDGDFNYAWTPGGRLAAVSSPLNSAYGTRYSYAAATGQVQAVATSKEDPILNGIEYAPFGDLTHYSAAAARKGDRLDYDREYALTGALSRSSWRDIVNNSYWMDRAYTYSPTGLLLEARDDARVSQSRRYDYDNLMRLTCERTVNKRGAYEACAERSIYTLGMFSYFDGESPSAPPDHRETAFVRGQTYTSPSTETYSYATASNRLTAIARGTSELVVSTDAAGRRQYEYDTADPVNSRREYIYLPSGQLGEIDGRDTTGTPYVIVLTYGIGGRLAGVSDSRGDDHALYWDDAGHLSGAALTIKGTAYRWHFHYLGEQPVAATRETLDDNATMTLGASASVQRYYLLQDRRGLVEGMVSPDGGLDYLANHSAHGDPLVEVNTAGLWLPFLLPGQLLIPGTDSPDGGPPLVANGLRVLDRATGTYLSADPADAFSRRDPEGYGASRNNPLTFADPTGGRASYYWAGGNDLIGFGPGKSFFISSEKCTAKHGERIVAAIRTAITVIAACTSGACGNNLGGPTLQARWLFALSVGNYDCAGRDEVNAAGDMYDGDNRIGAYTTVDVPMMQKHTVLPPKKLDPTYGCLAQLVAHEALHPALLAYGVTDYYTDTDFIDDGLVGLRWYNEGMRPYETKNGNTTISDLFPHGHPELGRTRREIVNNGLASPDESYVDNAVEECFLEEGMAPCRGR